MTRFGLLPRTIALTGAALIGALLAGGGFVAQAAPSPSPSPSPSAQPAATPVTLRLTELSPASLTADDVLRVRGTVTGTSSSPLRVRLLLHEGRLGTRPDVIAWSAARLAGPADADSLDDEAAGLLDATREVAHVDLPRTDGPTAFTLKVDAADLDLPTRRASFGPRGLAVEVLPAPRRGTSTTASEDDVLARETTFAVWRPRPDSPDYSPTRLSVLVPLTGVAAPDLASPASADVALAPGGRLEQVMAATDAPGIGWIVDPALVTAVARRGGVLEDAPAPLPGQTPAPTPSSAGPSTSPSGSVSPSGSPTGAPTPTASSTDATGADNGGDPGRARARSWIDGLALASRSRDVAWLPWGDPDVPAVAGAKAGDLLTQASQHARDVVDDVLGADSDTVWGLMDEGPVTQPGVDALAASGRRTVVVRAPAPPAKGATPPVAHRVKARAGDVTVLGADPAISAALTAAADPETTVVATQRLLAELAAVTLEDRDAGRQVLAVTPRSWTPSGQALQRALTALRGADWVQLRRPTELGLSPSAPEQRLDRVSAPGGARPLDGGHVKAVGDAFAHLQTFSGSLGDPEAVLGSGREQALSLVSASWRGQSAAALATARAPLTSTARNLLGGVSIVQGGPYNVVTSKGDLPLQLRNRTPYDLTVQLRLQPQSGQVETPAPLTVRLPARSPSHRVLVPLRTVASGDVSVVAQLNTPQGRRISPKVTLVLRVRREWESRGLIALITVTGGLLVVGILRTVRRGRKRIRAEDVPDIDDLAVAQEERRRSGVLVAAGGVSGVTASVAAPLVSGTLAGASRAATPLDPAGGGRAAGDGPDSGDLPPPSQGAGVPPEGGEPGDERDEAPAAAQLARNSALMAAGTLTSRLLGFARVSVLAAAIGMSGEWADAFSVANKIPNIVFMLIAGGVLNAVLVPQITRAARMGREGEIFVDRLLSAAIFILALITVIVTAAAPLLARLYSGGDVTPAQVSLATVFAFWCLPQVFFYGLYTVWGQVLNARGAFGAYMWAPVVNNVVAIAGLVVFIAVEGAVGATDGRSATSWTGGSVALLAGTATLGVVAQALVLWPVLRRTGFSWRPRWGWRGVGLGSASRVAGWTFAAVVLAQLGYIVTSKVLTSAGGLAVAAHGEEGARTGSALYDNAFLLFMLPHSLVAVSLVTALFTRLSRAAQAGDTGAVRADLSLGMRTMATASILATAGIMSLAPVAVRLLHWNPGAAYGAMAMSVGMVAFSASYLQQRVFYAYEDARTPFWVQVPAVAVTVTGSLLARHLLDPQWVLVGVGLGMSAANLLTSTLLARLLSRRLGGADGARVLSVHARLAVAGALAGGLAWLTVHGVVRGFGDLSLASAGTTASGAALTGGLIVLLGVYVGAARLLRVREIDLALGPVLRRVSGLTARVARRR
ncbi:MAG: murein biosynthesis integral membrane protein MurJ [Kineosporiaceae bacterium]